MYRTLRTSAVILFAAAALAGCSLSPSAPATNGAPSPSETPVAAEQSAKDACLALKPTLLDVNSQLSAGMGDLASDPEKASALLKDVSAELRDAIGELDNAEVVDVATTAVDSMDAMIVEVDKAIDGEGDQQALIDAATKVQTDFTAIDPICSAAVDG